MTAREHLDQLDALLNDGADLPWRVAHPFLTVIDTGDAMAQVETDHTYDADLIVAAVNSLPKLTAALRAVLELADLWDAAAELPGMDEGETEQAHDAAALIRTAITDALQ